MRKICSLEQTAGLARKLVKVILAFRNRRAAVVVALSGDLGSGKTTFTQFFARELGIKDKITSPTFVIQKKFEIRSLPAGRQGTKFETMTHIDAYRIDKPQEILDLGWEKLMADPQNIILVEWAEKIKKILPKDSIWIKFGHKTEKERVIKLSC